MRTNLTQSIEDYIKAIYECTQDGERATTNQLAEKLDVAPASVTGMIQTLAAAETPLVEYQKHRGVILTEPGQQIALEIVRHHRLLELFLHQVLGYDWDKVHAEADRLEHVISEEFEERIAQTLGNPQHDPHGDPIPTRDLQLPDTPSKTLFDLVPGSKGVVHRVASSDAELLRYLAELGIIPQATLEVTAYSPFDENLTILVKGQPKPVVLGPRVTRAVFVEMK